MCALSRSFQSDYHFSVNYRARINNLKSVNIKYRASGKLRFCQSKALRFGMHDSGGFETRLTYIL